MEKIKRIIAVVILSLLLISCILLRFATISSNAVEEVVVITTVATMIPPETTQPLTEAPTEPIIEPTIIDTTIVYAECSDKISLQTEIDKCLAYIEVLSEHEGDEILAEIQRISVLLETYYEEMLYMDKTIIDIPKQYAKNKDFKSYENYKAIRSKNSPHYKLQHSYAYSDNGFRKVNGRYCIAVGSYFTTEIGQYLDIVLANGTIIPCVLGDQKADRHTDDLHIAHGSDGSIVEFIVDVSELTTKVYGGTGNVSDCYKEWQSPVVQVIVYNINVFDK